MQKEGGRLDMQDKCRTAYPTTWHAEWYGMPDNMRDNIATCEITCETTSETTFGMACKKLCFNFFFQGSFLFIKAEQNL